MNAVQTQACRSPSTNTACAAVALGHAGSLRDDTHQKALSRPYLVLRPGDGAAGSMARSDSRSGPLAAAVRSQAQLIRWPARAWHIMTIWICAYDLLYRSHVAIRGHQASAGVVLDQSIRRKAAMIWGAPPSENFAADHRCDESHSLLSQRAGFAVSSHLVAG